jgi:hypothetical protein
MVEMPQLILGHLPFLGESYQGKLRNQEYVGRFSKIENTIRILTKAVEEYGITVLGAAPACESQLAEQLLEAIRVTSLRTGRKLSLIPCLRIPLTIEGVAVDDYRRWLSYYEVERKFDGKILERYLDDPILQCREGWREKLLHASVHSTPYSAREVEKLRVDYETARLRLDSLRGFDVLFVEPGSETDFLVASGRLDLLNGLVEWIRGKYGYEVILGTHHAGTTIPILEESTIEFQGYVTPINQLGVMMFPTQRLALDAVKKTSKPVIAIKPLAGGRIPPNQAFQYVYEIAEVDSCMVGVGSEEELDTDLKAAREWGHSGLSSQRLNRAALKHLLS